jgi:hypothetical protein
LSELGEVVGAREEGDHNNCTSRDWKKEPAESELEKEWSAMHVERVGVTHDGGAMAHVKEGIGGWDDTSREGDVESTWS